jgi:hypothetical protein
MLMGTVRYGYQINLVQNIRKYEIPNYAHEGRGCGEKEIYL